MEFGLPQSKKAFVPDQQITRGRRRNPGVKTPPDGEQSPNRSTGLLQNGEQNHVQQKIKVGNQRSKREVADRRYFRVR